MAYRRTKRTRMRKQRGGLGEKLKAARRAAAAARRDWNMRRRGLRSLHDKDEVPGGGRKKSRKKSRKKTGRLARLKKSMKKSARKMMKKLSKSVSSSRKGKKTKRRTTAKKVKKTKKGKKKMNAYMIALNKARKENAPSFVYKDKTYYQKTTKTGMVIYGSKK